MVGDNRTSHTCLMNFTTQKPNGFKKGTSRTGLLSTVHLLYQFEKFCFHCLLRNILLWTHSQMPGILVNFPGSTQNVSPNRKKKN